MVGTKLFCLGSCFCILVSKQRIDCISQFGFLSYLTSFIHTASLILYFPEDPCVPRLGVGATRLKQPAHGKQ